MPTEDVSNEADAKILLDKLSRREALHSTISKNPLLLSWRGIILGCFFMLLALLDSDNASSLCMTAVALLTFFGEYSEKVNRRIDALVKLLEEDGAIKGSYSISKDPSEK